MCVPSAAEMSCAVTRMRLPERRTLPSRTFVTPSACADAPHVFVPVLEREGGCARDDLESRNLRQRVDDLLGEAVVVVLFSLSPLRLANGSTAIDGWRTPGRSEASSSAGPVLPPSSDSGRRGVSRGIAPSRRARVPAAWRRAPADRRAGWPLSPATSSGRRTAGPPPTI